MTIAVALLLSLAGVVTSLVLDDVVFAYCSLVLALPCLAVIACRIWLDTRGPAPADVGEADAAGEEAASDTEAADDEDAAEADEPALVKVIPGRKRFHFDRCELLDGHEHEALTLVEATEEGFTQCSKCSRVREPA